MYMVGGLAELRTKLVDETCEQTVYDAVDSWKKNAPADSDKLGEMGSLCNTTCLTRLLFKQRI